MRGHYQKKGPNRNKSPWQGQRGQRSTSRGRFNNRTPSREGSNRQCLLIQACLSESDSDAFVLDTGASHHFCKDRDSFVNFEPVSDENVSVAISNATFPVEGKGEVHLKFESTEIVLKNCFYSPKLRRNLIAGNLIDKAGLTFLGKDGEIRVIKSQKVLFKAKLKGGIYYTFPRVIKAPTNNQISAKSHSFSKPNEVNFEASVTEKSSPDIWHRRFAHISTGILHKTSINNSVRGLPEMPSTVESVCEPCKLAKTKRVSFKSTGETRTQKPLELIYLDLCGPIDPEGFNGQLYFLSIVDDYSRKISAFPIRNKSDAFETFKRFQKRAERYLGTKIISVRTDNGGEFCNRQFEDYFSELGIKFEKTNNYTPEQNGRVERQNFTIMDGVKAMLTDSGMDRCFWTECVLTFVYVWNRTCHSGKTKTPIELFSGNKPSVRHLKPFGVVAYVGVPKQRRVKLDNRAKKGYMVGYALSTRGYRIWLPEENKIVETINVTFNEKANFKGDSFEEQSSISNFSDERSGAVMGTMSKWVIDISPNSSPSESSDSFSRPMPQHQQPQPEQTQTLIQHQTAPQASPVWRREVVPKSDGTRTYIYYFEGNSKQRLSCKKQVKKYCRNNNIAYDPNLFDFSGKNLTSGIVGETPEAVVSDGSDVSESDDAEESVDGGTVNLTSKSS